MTVETYLYGLFNDCNPFRTSEMTLDRWLEVVENTGREYEIRSKLKMTETNDRTEYTAYIGMLTCYSNH